MSLSLLQSDGVIINPPMKLRINKTKKAHRQIDLDGLERDVILRATTQARRMKMRIDQSTGTIMVTLPDGVKFDAGLEFVHKNQGWVLQQLKALPERVPFEDGAQVPLLDTLHTIRHCPEHRRGVWREENLICVSGQNEHLPRRVLDFLKKITRDEITHRVRKKVAALPAGHRSLGRINLRDARSRWGSCTSDGNLSFSWRLIFAPDAVFDYVIAHEVAHLVHMDHSPRFWRLVATLTENPEAARHWLKREGARLMRYG